jgi:hypothetical protein
MRHLQGILQISGEMVVKIHIRLQNAPGPLRQRSAFLYITSLMRNDSLNGLRTPNEEFFH